MEDDMRDIYLEVTFRKGKAIAAYLYLPRDPEEKSQRTEKVGEGILVDYGKGDRPIGIEITAPRRVSLEAVNHILAKLEIRLVQEEELAPLAAAY